MPKEAGQPDVVIVGSGAGALTCATVAAQHGLDVLVIEKTDYLGGTSATSGGMTWIPGNDHAARAGHADNINTVMTYLEGLIKNRIRRDVIESFLNNASRMQRYMETKTEVRFTPSDEPDYFPELDGAVKIGRSFNAGNYDGKRLGRNLSLLRPPIKELTAFGGAMFDRDQLVRLLGATRSPSNFLFSMRFLGRYLADKLRYGRGTHLTFGNALTAALLKSALDAGVKFRTGTPAVGLVRTGDRVTAVRVASPDGKTEIRVARGVLIATGGFVQSEKLRREFLDFPDQHVSMVLDTNKGDGIEIGRDIGAVVGSNNLQNALGYQVSFRRVPDGARQKMMLIMNERSRPGSVMVNKEGKRFANEAMPYHDLYRHQTTAGAVPAFLICDHAFLRKVGFGLVRPGPAFMRPLGRLIADGYLFRANTIRDLAGQLDINADALETTIANMNRYAAEGRDPEFGRGESLYDRRIGDPRHKPNPNLGPIENAPFYAIEIWPGSTGTLAGLLTDAHARVLDAEQQPINGLYACGLDMHSIFSGTFPGPGCSLGPAMTFGYLAALHMAGEEAWRARSNQLDSRAFPPDH